MTITIFHNPRCSKSRATLALLQEKGYEPEVRLYLEQAPHADEIAQTLELLGLNARELMRKGENEYKELGLAASELSEKDLINAMASHPRLIERPIVFANGKAAIGRPPESVLEIL